MKRPLADKRPFGPAFSQDELDSFRGPSKVSVVPGDGVYRLAYDIKSDEDKDRIKRDVESAVKSHASHLNIVVHEVFVNSAGLSGIGGDSTIYDAEVRFFPDVQSSLDQFAVNNNTVKTITQEIESIPHVKNEPGWELDFLVTK